MANDNSVKKPLRSIWVYAIPIGIVLSLLALLVSTESTVAGLAMHFIINAVVWSLIAAVVIWVFRKITNK